MKSGPFFPMGDLLSIESSNYFCFEFPKPCGDCQLENKVPGTSFSDFRLRGHPLNVLKSFHQEFPLQYIVLIIYGVFAECKSLEHNSRRNNADRKHQQHAGSTQEASTFPLLT